jgi:hypothetical protein
MSSFSDPSNIVARLDPRSPPRLPARLSLRRKAEEPLRRSGTAPDRAYFHVRALKCPHALTFVFSRRINLGAVARKTIAGVARETVAVIARGQPALEENVPTGTR